MIAELLALGHRVGNHTQDHCHLPGERTAADLAFEFKATQDILDKHICDNVFLFRAPFGELSPMPKKLIWPESWKWTCPPSES